MNDEYLKEIANSLTKIYISQWYLSEESSKQNIHSIENYTINFLIVYKKIIKLLTEHENILNNQLDNFTEEMILQYVTISIKNEFCNIENFINIFINATKKIPNIIKEEVNLPVIKNNQTRRKVKQTETHPYQ